MSALPAQRDPGPLPTAVGDARSQRLGKRSPHVRPEIARSWERSRAAGFTSTTQDWPTAARLPERTPVCKAFDDELVTRLPLLNRLGLAAILVDAAGTVVSHCGIPDGQENVHLVRAGALPPLGASLQEGSIGTHAANLALESGRPEQVVAGEHLHTRYSGMHSVAVPIVGITTTRTIGALVVESTTPAQPLLLPWAVEVTNAVRTRLRDACQERELLLMREFLATRSSSPHPVICLDQQNLVCNAAASRLLGGDDQALLWEHAAHFLKGDAPDTAVLTLNGTGAHVAGFEAIKGAEGPVGVRITLRAHKERASTRVSGSITTALTGALPAQSRRWLRLVEELETSLATSDRIVLVGEPGTGKRHIARALLPSTAVETDCTRGDETLTLLRGRTSNAQPLIITHIERLSDAALVEIREILAVESHPEAPVVFTLTRERRELESLTPHGNGIGPCIRVPALRDRLDDLPNLVAVLSAESAVEGKPPMRWMPDALQVLARVDWPQNLRSLQSVVDAVSRDCRTGYVDSRLLPEGVRAQGAGRRLSRLEQLEASEILASLREYDGNKLAAARWLGIARSTLYRRMRALGIDLAAVNY